MERGLLILDTDTASRQTPKKPDQLPKNSPPFSCHPRLAFLVSLSGSTRDCASGEVGWEEQEAAVGFPPGWTSPAHLHVLSFPPTPSPS